MNPNFLVFHNKIMHEIPNPIKIKSPNLKLSNLMLFTKAVNNITITNEDNTPQVILMCNSNLEKKKK